MWDGRSRRQFGQTHPILFKLFKIKVKGHGIEPSVLHMKGAKKSGFQRFEICQWGGRYRKLQNASGQIHEQNTHQPGKTGHPTYFVTYKQH
jgi:hypothetical protein